MAAPLPWTVCQNFLSIANTTVVTTAETVVLTMGPIDSQTPGRSIFFDGNLAMAVGGSTTSIQVIVRQDSLTGASITGGMTIAAAPATFASMAIPIIAADTTVAEMAGRLYVVTVKCNGAVANSSVNVASCSVYS